MKTGDKVIATLGKNTWHGEILDTKKHSLMRGGEATTYLVSREFKEPIWVANIKPESTH